MDIAVFKTFAHNCVVDVAVVPAVTVATESVVVSVVLLTKLVKLLKLKVPKPFIDVLAILILHHL